MPRILFISVFLVLSLGGTKGQQDSPADSAESQIDERQDIEPVNFDEDKLEHYKEGEAFDYSEEIEKSNWWGRVKTWVAQTWNSFWESIFGRIKPGSPFEIVLDILKYVVLAGLIALVIWLFTRLNPGKAILKNKQGPAVLFSEDEKIIRQKDIPTLIDEALAEKNYRRAIRFYYLLILKNMKEQDLIDYQSDKTNWEYQLEIKNETLRGQFKGITRIYDSVWYGGFQIDKNQFETIKTEFEILRTQLKNRAHAPEL